MEIIITSAFIVMALFLLFKYADKWIKTLPSKTIKTINWVGFSIAMVSGFLWYLVHDVRFMFITFAGVVVYFLFYNYDKGKEEKKDQTG